MVVIHTPTVEDYIEVVRWAVDQRMHWMSGSGYVHTDYWQHYFSDTCIMIEDNILSYCSRVFINDSFKNVGILDMLQFQKYSRRYIIKQFGKKFDLR